MNSSNINNNKQQQSNTPNPAIQAAPEGTFEEVKLTGNSNTLNLAHQQRTNRLTVSALILTNF
jgi:hypothetical protein